MSTFENDPNEVCGYGIFSLPADHPFEPACQAHDRIYESRDSGFKPRTRSEADSALLASMLRIAEERKSVKLKMQAYALYGIARAFGALFW